jgi:methylated-DNA-[protein]-cysteine S-methyltransferase
VKPELSKTFDQRCYDLLLQIPKGKVTTYREIAHALETKAYKAVGQAMNRNPNLVEVPCHRVVKSNGEVGGYATGSCRKLELLRREGVDVSEDGQVDLSKYLYFF